MDIKRIIFLQENVKNSDRGHCYFLRIDTMQWWGREFRCSLSLNMDKLFEKAITNVLYH